MWSKFLSWFFAFSWAVFACLPLYALLHLLKNFFACIMTISTYIAYPKNHKNERAKAPQEAERESILTEGL
jgi:hypothetical protein